MAVCTGCGESDAGRSYVIEGYVDELSGRVELMTLNNGTVLAATEVEDGEFRLELKSHQPKISALVINGVPSRPLFVDAPTIEIKGQKGKLEVFGSPSNEAYNGLQKELTIISHRLRQPGVDRESLRAEEKATMRRYYNENRDNLLAVYMLMGGLSYDSGLKPPQMIRTLDSLPEELKGVEEVQVLRRNAEAQILTAVGNEMVDVVLPDREGRSVGLKSVVADNRLVLIEFWTSSSVACQMEVPYLQRAYGDFHEQGFEIYGVSLDSEKEAWIGAIEGSGMMWLNFCDQKGWNTRAVKDYGVDRLPNNVLIDALSGRIVARNLHGEDLWKSVAKYFN